MKKREEEKKHDMQDCDCIKREGTLCEKCKAEIDLRLKEWIEKVLGTGILDGRD